MLEYHAGVRTRQSAHIDNLSLVLDLLEWIGRDARPYADVMQAWKTSCPRLPIWEDAVDAGLVALQRPTGAPMSVRVTHRGHDLLAENRASMRR